MQDLYAVSGTSPTSTSDSATDRTMFFAYRIRTAKPNARPGRWINSPHTFATFEAADLASKLAFNELWRKVKCRIEREVLGVVEW